MPRGLGERKEMKVGDREIKKWLLLLDITHAVSIILGLPQVFLFYPNLVKRRSWECLVL